MTSSDGTRRKTGAFLLLIVLAILAFTVLRPFLLAAVGGLLLAYIFYPVYNSLSKKISNKTLAASIMVIILLIIIIVPLRFLIPILIRQIFGVFTYSQSIDLASIVQVIFPTASDEFLVQMVVAANKVISSAASYSLNWLSNFFINIPNLAIKVLIAGFVFFFALKDQDRLKKLMDEISPLNKASEQAVVEHFKGLTNSIVYGNIIVGIVQGILAGVGFFVFGIPNAFVLTMIAIVLSIIPFIGPALLWIPVTIYLFTQGNGGAAIAYLLYNVFIVSTVDNILRSYIVSRQTKISQMLVFVGMVGGFLVFGMLGLILGPLILAYFMMFLELYRNNKLDAAFND